MEIIDNHLRLALIIRFSVRIQVAVAARLNMEEAPARLGFILPVSFVLFFSMLSHNFADVLINGRVEYSVRFLGTREVDKAKGTDTIRDALTAIRFHQQVSSLSLLRRCF